MIPLKSLPASIKYSLKESRLRQLNSVLWIICEHLQQGFRPTGVGNANLYWRWGAELAQKSRLPGTESEHRPTVIGLHNLGARGGCYFKRHACRWLNSTTVVPWLCSHPLLYIRNVFTHCFPQQELHCKVKFTIN